MKELSSHPRSRLITLPQHDDPLGRFSDHEDSGPLEVAASADVYPDPGYRTRPHEVTGYFSASGPRLSEPEATADDWSLRPAATWEDLGETPAYYPQRYQPRQPRTVQMVGTVAVLGLLGYSLYLDRPEFSELKSWLTRSDVIELPAIAPPPRPSRLADEPGRVATPSSERVATPSSEEGARLKAETAAPPPDSPTRPDAAEAGIGGLNLLVNNSGVSLTPGRRTTSEERRTPTAPNTKSRDTGPAATASPASLTHALNAASLATSATRSANSQPAAPPAPSRNGDDAQIKRVLTDFQVAYNALDVEGTRKLWPAADATALARVFQSLRSQHVELAGCQVVMAGDRAKAVCSGQARMVPKDKAPRIESRLWTFDFARTVDRWDVVALNLK